MPLSDYAAGTLLGFFRGVNITAPTVYVSLHDGDPGVTGINEVTSSVTASGRPAANSWQVTGNRSISTLDPVDFGTALTTITVTHFGLWDAASGGNFLGGEALVQAQELAEDFPVVFDGNQIRIQA